MVRAVDHGIGMYAFPRLARCMSIIMTHECAKSSLAFRKPATAAASRRPARTEGALGRP